MNKTMLLACLLISSATYADNTGLAVGFGIPYSGVGAKYSVGNASTSYFGSIGYVKNVEEDPGKIGINLGFDHRVFNGHHTIGASIGSISSTTVARNSEGIIGLAANYAYHFSGIDQKSWVLGAGVFVNLRALNAPVGRFASDEGGGIRLAAGYHF